MGSRCSDMAECSETQAAPVRDALQLVLAASRGSATQASAWCDRRWQWCWPLRCLSAGADQLWQVCGAEWLPCAEGQAGTRRPLGRVL